MNQAQLKAMFVEWKSSIPDSVGIGRIKLRNASLDSMTISGLEVLFKAKKAIMDELQNQVAFSVDKAFVYRHCLDQIKSKSEGYPFDEIYSGDEMTPPIWKENFKKILFQRVYNDRRRGKDAFLFVYADDLKLAVDNAYMVYTHLELLQEMADAVAYAELENEISKKLDDTLGISIGNEDPNFIEKNEKTFDPDFEDEEFDEKPVGYKHVTQLMIILDVFGLSHIILDLTKANESSTPNFNRAAKMISEFTGQSPKVIRPILRELYNIRGEVHRNHPYRSDANVHFAEGLRMKYKLKGK